jgi:hypothetical protein
VIKPSANHYTVRQDHWHPPVVEPEEFVVRVDVAQLRLQPERPQVPERVLTQMTTLPSHQDQPHGPKLASRDVRRHYRLR